MDLTVFWILLAVLLAIFGLPLLAYLVAKAFTIGMLEAKHRFFHQHFEKDDNGDES